MALSDNLLTEKQSLTALLESEYSEQNLRDQLLQRLFFVRFLLGELVGSGGGGGGGDASAANQTAVQANAGSDASKAISIQGITNGKAISVSLGAALPTGSNTIGAISNTSFGISGTLPAFASTPTVNIGTAPNIAIIGVADGEPVGINNAHVIHNESQLSAPGSTNSRNMNGFNRAFITATVANINTNVVLRIEGSNDNSNWVNLSASDADTTITANGTYGFQYVGCPQHIRTTFVSESGGTSATVNVITRLSA